MKSKVHPTYKTKYRVANWPAYNQALVRRGDVTVWLSAEAIAAWTASRSGRRGGQRRYSDLAIETALTLRLLYHLPLRQAEGFLHALFGMMRLDLSAPDYTTLSRRSQHLKRRLRLVPPGEGLHLVLDSTGLSIVGAGGHGPRSPARDRTITLVKQLGRRRWKQVSWYHRQGRVENAFFRYKSIIGDGLRARSPARQGSEVVLGCEILNRMTALGRPVLYRIGM